jgi:hypothetical protein
MAVPNSEVVQWLPSGSTSAESHSGRIGLISLEAKQTGERSAGNPHAAFDEAGAGNVARPRWCDTRRRKSEPTGNTNFGLNRRASLRPYLCGARSAKSVPAAICFPQFMEFLGGIADSSADGNIVRLPPVLFQPIAADDVAAIVAEVALAAPRNGIVEIAGPERGPFNEIVARYLKAIGDPREVVRDPEARYRGGPVEERALVPLGEVRLGRIGLDEWLRRSRAAARQR